eukprot:11187111-Lingulodinium_polyedra.AAC.1
MEKSPPEWHEAAKFFERGLQCCPESVRLWLCSADCEIRQQKYDKARLLLGKARRRNPHAIELLLKGVDVEKLCGNEARAHRLLSRAVTLKR